MLYESVADLSLEVDEYALETRERETSSDFTRVTTVVELSGDGETGRGEDVTYDAEDHETLSAYEARLPVVGDYSLHGFSDRLDDVNLFPGDGPQTQASRHYRRWAFESAALDLALRQAGTNLGAAVGRNYDPVEFVASTRLGDPPSTDRLAALLDVNPDLGFKLDPTPEWSDDLVERIADLADVRVLDLKGQYEGTGVDNPADPDLYERVIEGFPGAVIEDPRLTEETEPIVDRARDRVSWDYPITGIESVENLPFEPSWLNIKPSRFGTVESLLETVEYCERRDIRTYGGGQFELDVGRGQIQVLASLFYPTSPNDVAPKAYNDPDVPSDLPASPLDPSPDPVGFGW